MVSDVITLQTCSLFFERSDLAVDNASREITKLTSSLLINIIMIVISTVLKLSVAETGIHHQISFQITQCQQRD